MRIILHYLMACVVMAIRRTATLLPPACLRFSHFAIFLSGGSLPAYTSQSRYTLLLHGLFYPWNFGEFILDLLTLDTRHSGFPFWDGSGNGTLFLP